jgi:hypothetical protein
LPAATLQRESVAHSKIESEWDSSFEKGEAFEMALRICVQGCTPFEFSRDFLIKLECIEPEVLITII